MDADSFLNSYVQIDKVAQLRALEVLKVEYGRAVSSLKCNTSRAGKVTECPAQAIDNCNPKSA